MIMIDQRIGVSVSKNDVLLAGLEELEILRKSGRFSSLQLRATRDFCRYNLRSARGS